MLQQKMVQCQTPSACYSGQWLTLGISQQQHAVHVPPPQMVFMAREQANAQAECQVTFLMRAISLAEGP